MATFEKISTYTATGSVTNFSLTSIPATYTDLFLAIKSNSASTADWHMQFNTDTGANYSYTYAYSQGADPYAGMYNNLTAQTDIYIGEFGVGTSMFMINIFNYANTNILKTATNLVSYGTVNHGADIGSWNNTAAITSIKIFHSSTSVTAGTTATLYGILGA